MDLLEHASHALNYVWNLPSKRSLIVESQRVLPHNSTGKGVLRIHKRRFYSTIYPFVSVFRFLTFIPTAPFLVDFIYSLEHGFWENGSIIIRKLTNPSAVAGKRLYSKLGHLKGYLKMWHIYASLPHYENMRVFTCDCWCSFSAIVVTLLNKQFL